MTETGAEDVRRRSRLEIALREARRIRRNLVRLRCGPDLCGDCGLGSVLLAVAISDVDSLRHTEDMFGRGCAPHVWNEVEGVIIDVTATQFNDCAESCAAAEPPVRGVLITREPRVYHRPITGRGMQTVTYLRAEDWYWSEERTQRRFCALLAALEALKGNRETEVMLADVERQQEPRSFRIFRSAQPVS